MDREAWRAAIHAVAKSRTRLRDWTELNGTLRPFHWKRPWCWKRIFKGNIRVMFSYGTSQWTEHAGACLSLYSRVKTKQQLPLLVLFNRSHSLMSAFWLKSESPFFTFHSGNCGCSQGLFGSWCSVLYVLFFGNVTPCNNLTLFLCIYLYIISIKLQFCISSYLKHHYLKWVLSQI